MLLALAERVTQALLKIACAMEQMTVQLLDVLILVLESITTTSAEHLQRLDDHIGLAACDVERRTLPRVQRDSSLRSE